MKRWLALSKRIRYIVKMGNEEVTEMCSVKQTNFDENPSDPDVY